MRSDLTFLSYIVWGYSFFVDTVYVVESRNLDHRRRLYVSGTGTEGSEKRQDVDGVEWVGVSRCPLVGRPGGLENVVSFPVGNFLNFVES